MKGQQLIFGRSKRLICSGLFLLLSALFGVACKQKSSTTEPINNEVKVESTESSTSTHTVEPTKTLVPDTFLYYKRTPCFGMCAIFTMTVFSNGEVEYSGKNFTNLIGEYRTQLDKTILQNMTVTAEEIGYFRMLDSYDNEGVTDLPSIYTALKKDNKLKWVKNRYNGPKELKALYSNLDKVIAEAQWEAVK